MLCEAPSILNISASTFATLNVLPPSAARRCCYLRTWVVLGLAIYGTTLRKEEEVSILRPP